MDKNQSQIVCLISSRLNELLTELVRTIASPRGMDRYGSRLALEKLLNQALGAFLMLKMPAAKQLTEFDMEEVGIEVKTSAVLAASPGRFPVS